MNVSVVTIQIHSSPKVEDNLTWLAQQLSKIERAENTLVVLPECFACFGGSETAQQLVAEDYGNGPIQDFIAHQAKKYDLWIVAGSMPIKCPSTALISAASLLFSPDGQCHARYNKIHLFDVEIADNTAVYRESGTTIAGTEPVVAHTPFANIGMSVCYDVRFPELYRHMQAKGADIIVIPSAFTHVTGEAHWDVLMRARAIENQCFVVAANQTGIHQNGRETYGHSLVVDPWGSIVHQHAEQSGIRQSDIDLNQLNQIRRKMPNLQHRKFL
ncbi:amidohydrolase [Catenovulum agarivorans DS-2]|uniref:Amidohydrolase n=1 Tax=Catenovulum agarivorans DS-2 TaxID=1328313 RepID=W7QFC7_9ALTE|nr:carbon-nitrogen hydrolase family protein [Catenovulum agarivorans]EWH11609.1 amidohydrolase [Catenovulum agarivorans DS-2]